MSDIKTLVFTLCLVSLVAGTFRMVAPSGGLQRTAVMIMGLFTLSCFLTPFSTNWNVKELFDFSLEELTPSRELVAQNRQVLEQAAVEEITQTVLQIAQTQGVSVQVTQVEWKEQAGMLLAQRLELVVAGNEEQALRIRQKVLDVVKCEVSVAWTKE